MGTEGGRNNATSIFTNSAVCLVCQGNALPSFKDTSTVKWHFMVARLNAESHHIKMKKSIKRAEYYEVKCFKKKRGEGG